jgi:hypothetical protein
MKRRCSVFALVLALMLVLGNTSAGAGSAQSRPEVIASTALGTLELLPSSDGKLHYQATLSKDCYAVLGTKSKSGELVVQFFDTREAFEAAKVAAGIDAAEGEAVTSGSYGVQGSETGSSGVVESAGADTLATSVGPGWHTIRAEGVIGASGPANCLQTTLTYYSSSGVSNGSRWANSKWWPYWTYNGSSVNSLTKATNSSYYKYVCTQNFKVTSGGVTYYNWIRNTIYGYSGGAWQVFFNWTIDSRLSSLSYWFSGFPNNNGWLY